MAEEKKGSVEEVLDRLEEITQRMEEELPLDEMLNLYKEGKKLQKEATQMLDLAEKELKVLSANEDPEEE